MTTDGESAADRLERALEAAEEKKRQVQQLTPEQQERMRLLLQRTAQLPAHERKKVFEDAGLPLLASRAGLSPGRTPAPFPESRVTGGGRATVIFDPKPPKGPIEWEVWSSTPVLPLWMAVALSLGINPGPLRQNAYSLAVRSRERAARIFGDEFATRLDVAVANLNLGGPLASVQPFSNVESALVTVDGFFQFARGLSRPWSLPEEFPGRTAELVSVLPTEPMAPSQDTAMQGRRPIIEPTADRRARRLARFRELGGDIEKSGGVWRKVGRHGALAELAREEEAAGRQMKDRNDIKEDLFAAGKSIEDQMG